MEYLPIVAAAAALIFAGLSFFLFLAKERLRAQLLSSGLSLEELNQLRKDDRSLREAKATAEARLAEVEKQLHASQQQRDELASLKEAALKEAALARQQVLEEEKRRKDWEEQRSQLLQKEELIIAQAEKRLLELHRKETEESRKKSEEITKKNSEEVLSNLGKLIQSVAVSNENYTRNENKWDALMKAMSAPSSVGALAELGLENTLKNFGLESPRDYVTQYTIKSGAGGLRPDAVIKLPHDRVVVIDCKASKHVLEVVQAESEQQHAEALAKLKASMNKHLDALKSKDYTSAMQHMFNESGSHGKISSSFMVMYLPSESALEKLCQADSEFLSKCEHAGIIPATPTSLFGLLQLANCEIGLVRQNANHERIMQEVGALVQYCITALGYAENMGKTIESSMKHYNDFARSVNGRLLGKLRTTNELGVPLPKGKTLPSALKIYEVHSSTSQVIEGESELLETGKVETFPLSVRALESQ